MSLQQERILTHRAIDSAVPTLKPFLPDLPCSGLQEDQAHKFSARICWKQVTDNVQHRKPLETTTSCFRTKFGLEALSAALPLQGVAASKHCFEHVTCEGNG